MAYTPFKMKGHTLPGIKQKASSPSKFNKGLKAASKAGKLDGNPKFKAAVDSAPTKKMHDAPTKKMHDAPTKKMHDAPTKKMHDSPTKKMHKSPTKKMHDSPAKGYKSAAQRKAVHASKKDGGKGAPTKKMHSPAKMDPMTMMAVGKVAGKLMGGKKEDK
tara:strand:+ start:3810 stop:4289 length:480 start_codon:yes stop_codon:yes gene_type:complete